MNTTTASPEADTRSAINPEPSIQIRPQPLCRPFQDRMLAGVAAGFARSLGVDVTIVRIVLAGLTVVGGVGVPLYLAGLLLIPEGSRAPSIASQVIPSPPARSSHQTRDLGPIQE